VKGLQTSALEEEEAEAGSVLRTGKERGAGVEMEGGRGCGRDVCDRTTVGPPDRRRGQKVRSDFSVPLRYRRVKVEGERKEGKASIRGNYEQIAV